MFLSFSVFCQALLDVKAHNTSPLPRLQRRQIFVVFPIIQYRPALCKAGGGDFPSFIKPTEFGPSLLILKREPRRPALTGPRGFVIITKMALLLANRNMQQYRSGHSGTDSKDSRPLVNLSARNGLTAGFSSGAHLNFPLLSCIEILHFSKCLAGRCLKIKYAAVSKRS